MKHSAGFTLVEVLIALMIIAIALTAAIRATTESVRATEHVKKTMAAHWVGMNVLSEVQTGMVTVSQADGTAEGKSEMFGQMFAWHAKVDASSSSAAVARITVVVRFRDQVVNTVIGYEDIHAKK